MYCVQTREELLVVFMIMYSLTTKSAAKRKVCRDNRKLGKSILKGRCKNNHD